MTRQERADKLLELLKEAYPQVDTPLNYNTPYELLFAVMLSAQTTDVAVNKVTPQLFSQFTTLEQFAAAEVAEIKDHIRTIGLFNTKANNIKAAAQKLIRDYDSKVPQNVQDLMSLPGVGRKTAVVVLFHAFGINAGIATDTHVQRLSKWFGLTDKHDVQKIEQDLMQLYPQQEWGEFSLRLIFLGREQLTARSPQYKGTRWEPLLVGLAGD